MLVIKMKRFAEVEGVRLVNSSGIGISGAKRSRNKAPARCLILRSPNRKSTAKNFFRKKMCGEGCRYVIVKVLK